MAGNRSCQARTLAGLFAGWRVEGKRTNHGAQISQSGRREEKGDDTCRHGSRHSDNASQDEREGNPAPRPARDRFQEDLNAFLNGDPVRGASLGTAQEPAVVENLQAIKTRWDRMNAALERVIGSETTLVAVAKGNEAAAESTRGLPELAQQAGQQLLQAGGSPRDVEIAGQLAVLAQRITKNLGTLTSADDVDADIAVSLNKDVA